MDYDVPTSRRLQPFEYDNLLSFILTKARWLTLAKLVSYYSDSCHYLNTPFSQDVMPSGEWQKFICYWLKTNTRESRWSNPVPRGANCTCEVADVCLTTASTCCMHLLLA